MMVDADTYRVRRLRDLRSGELFIPAAADGDFFLAGDVNGHPVLVSLTGPSAFQFQSAEDLTGGPGLAVGNGLFQVDPSSRLAMANSSDLHLGSLLISGARTMLLARSSSGTHRIDLLGGGRNSYDDDPAIAFTSWQFVTGSGGSSVIHFQRTA